MSRPAFTLLEVVLALAVLGFCLVSILGLMPLGLEDYRWASSAGAAALLLEAIHGDLAVAVGRGATHSDGYGVELPSDGQTREAEFFLDQNGQRCGSADACWRVIMRLRRAHRTVIGELAICWPARAGDTGQRVESFLALAEDLP